MLSNSKGYFTNYLLKVILITCVVSVLFVVNSMLTNNNFEVATLRQPDILEIYSTKFGKKDSVVPSVSTSQVEHTRITERTTSSTNKPNKVIQSEGNNGKQTMSSMLSDFPWKELEKGAENNQSLYLKHRQSLIDKIEKFAYLEPNVQINTTCHAPNLVDPSTINCAKYPNAFLPNKFNKTVKVGHAIQLGFDVDTLEIHLNEIYDVIDFFFIIESTHIHCESFRKQLTWDQVSTQPRFSKFRKKGK